MIPIHSETELAYSEEALRFLMEGPADWTNGQVGRPAIVEVVEFAASEARREMIEKLMSTNRGVV